MNWTKRTFIFLTPCIMFFNSCNSIDLFEKTVTIPGHSWKSEFKPAFSFSIKDTAANYQLFIVLRHNDKYSFNNIFINLYIQAPGRPEQKIMLDLPLATNEKGWLASGMDDIYEHRIPFVLAPRILDFKKAGNYQFRMEQIMRQDPLDNILNAGLRIEKKL